MKAHACDPALGKLRQEDCELRPAWDTTKTAQKNENDTQGYYVLTQMSKQRYLQQGYKMSWTVRQLEEGAVV